MIFRKAIFLFLLVNLVTGFCYSQESSVYILGRGGSFSPLLPSKGWAAKSISSLYWAKKIADKDGNKSKLSESVNGFYQQFMANYVFNTNVLGAKYVVGVMLPFATAESNPTNSLNVRSRLFMSDPYISPVGLSWQKSDYQVFLEYRLYLPWGQFDESKSYNIGKGHSSHLISLNSTIFFDQFKYWSASLMPRFEFHNKQKSGDIKTGSYFNFEWAITNSTHRTIDIGFTGYAGFQLNKDSGEGVPPAIAGIKDKVVALGGELGLIVPKIKTRFAFRGFAEVYGADTPIGAMIALDIYYVPNRLLFENYFF